MKIETVILLLIILVLSCESRHDARCISGDCINGYGEMKWEEKTYKGEWRNGRKFGKGEMLWNDGGYEKGTWKNDTLNGYIEQYFGTNSVYAGDSFKGLIENNNYNGYGIYYHRKDDVTYIGNLINGKKDGFGIEKYGDKSEFPGRIIRGEWKNNMIEGFAIDSFGKTGKWANDIYKGNWKDNKRNGEGTYFWSNGSYFKGCWKNGKQDGAGVYVFPDGKTFHGVWINGSCNELFKILKEKK